MPKIYPLLATLAAVFISTLSTPAQAQDGLAAIRAAGQLRVGAYHDNPPFGYTNSRGRLNGYDIFLARRLAEDLLGDADKIEFIPVTAASRVEDLEKNRVDIILANFTVTPERAARVDFASPYMKTALAVVSPENAPVANVQQLSGHKLIVVRGSTGETFFSKNHPEVKLMSYDQHSAAFQALAAGRGVAMAHDSNLIYAWMSDNPGFVTDLPSLNGYSDIAPAVQKGNYELLEWLNGEIRTLQRAGFFQKAYDQTLRPVFGDKVDPLQVLP